MQPSGQVNGLAGATKRRFRLTMLLLTAILPGALKRFVYRWVFGYQIGRNVRIGFALLDCARLSIGDDSVISHAVAFLRCGEVCIGQHVQIGPCNIFRGGQRIELDDYCQLLRLNVINAIPDNDCFNAPQSIFSLGYGSVVTAEHRIDFTDRVTIGRCTTLAGRNSSIWTHTRRKGSPVKIGDFCYVGSEVRFAPGVRLGDCCIVGLGAVITRGTTQSDWLIVGMPAQPIRRLRRDDYELIFAKTRPDLPDWALEDDRNPFYRPVVDLLITN
jgi:acetyltransferase-like isoleucine patch superfamily enzyme